MRKTGFILLTFFIITSSVAYAGIGSGLSIFQNAVHGIAAISGGTNMEWGDGTNIQWGDGTNMQWSGS